MAAAQDEGKGDEPSEARAAQEEPALRAVGRSVRLRVRRQEAADKPDTRRWDEFEVAWKPRMSIVAALLETRRNPTTVDGRSVASVAWDDACTAHACGTCTMLVNGSVRQPCRVLVDDASPNGKPIVLEPLRKFPLVRDLVVDRRRIFDDYGRLRAYLDLDGVAPTGAGPPQSADARDELYALSRCTSCGACLEACPEYGEDRDFVGAAALNHVRLVGGHPTGALQHADRLEAAMAPGGVSDCGKAQNCVEVCPMGIPLVDSIQTVARQATKRMIFGWLLG